MINSGREWDWIDDLGDGEFDIVSFPTGSQAVEDQ